MNAGVVSLERPQELVPGIQVGCMGFRYFPETDDFELLYANPAASWILGFELQGVLGKRFRDFDAQAEPHPLFEVARRVATGTTPHFVGRFELGQKEPLQGAFDVDLFSVNAGELCLQFVSVVEVSRQTSARKRLEGSVAELSSTNQQLDEFAHVVAHDLKAPLRGITMTVDWIKEELEPQLSEDGRENLELLMSRSRHLTKLVDGILRYTRARRVVQEPTQVSIESVLRDVTSDLGETNIELVGAQHWPSASVNAIQLSQVLANLVQNGLKHGAPPIQVAVEDMGPKLQVTVSDAGPGIPESAKERIFELFTTAEGRGGQQGSAGVGLSICKALVEGWGGEITVDDGPYRGASFSFTVDRATSSE